MGSPRDERGRYDNEGSTRRVTITRPFLLQQHEVTRAQFAAFVEATGHVTSVEQAGWGMGANGHERRDGITWKEPPSDHGDVFGPDHPVVLVSWHDAVAYADWRSGQDQLAPCREPSCTGWRLPTEAEWEWAARAGTSGSHGAVTVEGSNCAGDPALAKVAWFCGSSEGAPHEVGRLEPNAWGLYDMQGNVWEWVGDSYDEYGRKPATDPTGGTDDADKATRGGGWGSRIEDCRTAVRVGDEAQKGFDNLGFRLARTIAP